MRPTIAIGITTRNRRAELARTLSELKRLSPPPDELVIVADGCSDGTAELIQAEFPTARLIDHEVARGSIPSRNEIAAATGCDVILSLDDDSYPVEADVIAHIAAVFAERPRLAVLCFPQRSEEFPESLTAVDFGPARFVGSFANSGAAIRRSVFRELGGYPEQFGHMYEEPDYALRCVAAGWEVWQDTARTIRHHFTSMQRNEMRNHQRHACNELWSVFLRCPAPQIVAVAAYRVARQFGYACSRGVTWALREPQWWCAALTGLPRCLAARRPLPWRAYAAWMKLVGNPITTEQEWAKTFMIAPR